MHERHGLHIPRVTIAKCFPTKAHRENNRVNTAFKSVHSNAKRKLMTAIHVLLSATYSCVSKFSIRTVRMESKTFVAKFERFPDNSVMMSGSAPAALVTRRVTKLIGLSPATNTGSPKFQLHLVIPTDATFSHSMGAPPLQLTASDK